MSFKCVVLALVLLASITSAHGAERGLQPALSLRFEANLGQADDAVRFLSRGSGFGLFLMDREAVLRLAQPKPAAIRITLPGQNPKTGLEGIDPLPGMTHYLRGASPSSWHGDVPAYARVRYPDVYPGIDLVYYGSQRQLEYDFVVRPGARPEAIQLHFDGVRGVQIDNDGRLVLRTAGGQVIQQKPVVYQPDGDRRIPVEGTYVLQGKRRVGFRIPSYDSTKPLIIDPVLVYSSYFGGTGTADQGNAVAVDAAGNAYVAGQTSSTDLLTIKGVQGALRGQLDGFVLKLDPKGTTVLYSTYFGGSGNDEAHSIAVDSAGNAYVTGYTSSSDFPIVNGFQRTRGGGLDAYFLKLNSTGDTILYSSYIGGSGDDRAYGLALDQAGNAYLTGSTGSTNFPTVNPLQRTNAGGLNDVFVTKIGPGGNIVYSTYVGGIGQDQSYGIAVDTAGAAYVTGYSSSLNFPLVNNIQLGFAGGSDDAFLFKVNAAGSALEYSTLIGGYASDNGVRVAVDDAGGAYVTGYTSSPNFPTLKPYQATLNQGAPPNTNGQYPFDAFIARFAPDGKSLVFSTFYGGFDADSGTSIVVDRAGSIYVAGYTSSFDLPVVNAIQTYIGGNRDAYLVKLTPDGGTIIFATYLGGLDAEAAVGLAVDSVGNAYVTGLVDSTDFPLATPFQEANGAAQDAFIAKIDSQDIVATSDFQIADQGGMSVETRGTRTDSVFGYATAQPTTAGTRLNGLAIVDHRQAGSLTTEVGIPAPPFTEVGRMFVDTVGAAQTVISIANPNDQDATVDLYFTDEAGVTGNFATVTVNAHAHFSRFVTDDPLHIPAGQIGAITYTSSVPVAVGGFRGFNNESSEFLLSNIPIADPLKVSNEPVVIPQFAEGAGWNTQVVLVNTTEDRMGGEIHFLSPGSPAEPGGPVDVGVGDAFASVLEYDIPARSAQRIQTAGSTTKSDFPFAAKSGTSFQTPGSGTVQLHGFAIADSTARTPVNGLEILEYRQSNVTNSQVGIIAPPLRQSGRLFVEVNDKVRSMIALANPADEDAVVEFSYTDSAGTTSAPVSVTVPAGGQTFNFVGDTPISIPSNSAVALSFISSIPVSASALRFLTATETNQSVISAIPIANVGNVSNQPVSVPQFTDGGGWKSQIILVNTTDDQLHGEVQFFSQGSASEPGQRMEVGIGDGTASIVEYDIPPRGAQRIETAGTADALSVGWLAVVPFPGNNTPHAHVLLSLQNSGVPVLQTAVEAQSPATSFRLYAEASGKFDLGNARSTRTAVAFANPFPSEAAVQLELTSLDGTSLGTSAPIRVPPNGQVSMFLNQVPGFQTLPVTFRGFLRVTATSGAIAAAGLRAMYNEGGIFLMTTTGPLNEDASSAARLTFPYITDSSGYTTEIILTSASPQPNISGTLRFLSQDATPLALADLRIGSVHVIPFPGFNTPHVHAIVSHQAEGVTTFQTAIEGQVPGTSFRLYAEASGDYDAVVAGSTRTNIALANPYDVPVSVRLDVTTFDGQFVGSSKFIEIPANGQFGIFLDQIPGLEAVTAPFKGVVKAVITSGAGFTVAGFRTRLNEQGRLLMTTTGPFKEDAGSPAQLVFPHIAEGSGYTTQFIVVGGSSGQGRNSGVLSFFNQEGAPLNVTLADQ